MIGVSRQNHFDILCLFLFILTIAVRAQVATNKKVNKTVKTLTYSLFPVPCSLKSSIIFAPDHSQDCYIDNFVVKKIRLKKCPFARVFPRQTKQNPQIFIQFHYSFTQPTLTCHNFYVRSYKSTKYEKLYRNWDKINSWISTQLTFLYEFKVSVCSNLDLCICRGIAGNILSLQYLFPCAGQCILIL